MILERLVLENYKQFRDRVELRPPEGAIGVVGPNGSGKTTIFESILWAFFGSRGRDPRFSNDSIPWSGGTTAERTAVEATLVMGGVPYTVVRTLHKNRTDARVYAGDEELVGGPSEVSEWVQEHLLGMDRTAFEATFFARQKELEFFAGVTGVKRQREIARILSLDQVEAAQELLRADKKDLLAEAKFLEARVAGVDLDALEGTLEEARERHLRLEGEADRLRERLKSAEVEFSAARAEGEKLEEAYRRHNDLSGSLSAAESARERAELVARELRERLEGLDADEATIEKLRPEAERLPGVEAEIEALEEARRRRERLDAVGKEIRRRKADAQRAVVAASDLLEGLDAAVGRDAGEDGELLPGWKALLSVEDEAGRMIEAKEVLDGARVYLWGAEDRLEKLREAKRLHGLLREAERELEEAQAGHEEGRERVARLDEELEQATGGGALEETLLALRKEERRLERQSAQQKGLADADERDAQRLERARHMIEAEEAAECPTCRRGFARDEHAEVMETLLRQAEEARGRAEEARSECRRLEGEARDLLGRVAEAEELKERAYALREERARAATHLEDLRGAVERASARVEGLRGEIEGGAPFSEDALDEAEAEAGLLRTLHDAHPRMEHLVEKHAEARASVAELEEEIAGLKEMPGYAEDAEARHVRLREEKAELERLLGRIETIRARLRGRPEVEEKLAAAIGEGEEAAREAGRLRAEMSALAFDEDAYLANRRRVAEAEELREGLRGEKEGLDEDLRGVRSKIETAETEISRYKKEREAADEKAREGARLGEMDRLLARFYKELTARVRPRLEEEASDLVKTLTDGRYERMEFDENYGVRLFDGLSEAYELSRFSGGEADVVSLSARVALSKMVAAKGSESLGFIVLDEVFGALDADRRRNVLLALDRLKRTFGQIFVISHVVDVQESALLDELWIVEEDEAGRSTVRRVETGPTSEPVEFLGGARSS